MTSFNQFLVIIIFLFRFLYHFNDVHSPISAASEHPYNGILSGLPKSGGGEFGKFYSLPALNDPRIGKFVILEPIDFSVSFGSF